MSNSSDASELDAVTELYSIYSTFIIVGLGLIGHLLNILIFTNLNIFRHNRCAFYLIVESIIDIIQLMHIFVDEIWKLSIDKVEPTDVSLVWCKIKNTLPQWCRFMLGFIVCFAAFDQFLSTNYVAYLRQLSSLKLAQRQIVFASFLCLLHTIPFAIFLDIRFPSGCIITNTILVNYYSFFYYPVLNGLLPIFLSCLFSILAYQNVRRIIRRQIPIDRRRLDQQLTAMIFIRVISYMILSLPYIIYRIYSLNVTINRTDVYRYAVNQLVYSVVVSLIFLNQAVIFLLLIKESFRNMNRFRLIFMSFL
jgi:hypothetical protein